mmetsp:Transcript_33262/g.67113  ORF Transcript_33262/g.67113 Transcript_33262/m.67113 type:complete len:170 (-) Transcript_33262:1061-1570(-)
MIHAQINNLAPRLTSIHLFVLATCCLHSFPSNPNIPHYLPSCTMYVCVVMFLFQKKKNQLKPRSAEGAAEAARSDATGGKAKSNPFGAAKPREEVLQKKGVDVKLVDSRIDKKAEVLHFTKVRTVRVVSCRADSIRFDSVRFGSVRLERPIRFDLLVVVSIVRILSISR